MFIVKHETIDREQEKRETRWQDKKILFMKCKNIAFPLTVVGGHSRKKSGILCRILDPIPFSELGNFRQLVTFETLITILIEIPDN